MADMNSTLGLDVSGALASLAKADEAAAKFDATLNKLAGSMSKIGGIKSGLEQVGQSAGGINSATSAVNSFSISWDSMSKLVVSRMISQGIFAVKSAIVETVQEAMQLEKSLQKVANISGLDTGSLQTQVRQMSEGMAISLESATKALETAWRSNVGGEAQTKTLLTASTNLAKATAEETSTAVTAVAGVVKGYGLSVADAAKVSSELLATTQRCRGSIEDIGGVMGKSAPLARALGVSYQELLASMDTLVASGMSVGQSGAVLERTLRGLAKPTATMSEAIHTLGYNSAESMLAARHFGGALQALANTTDLTAEGLMKLSSRGTGGQFSLGTIQATEYAAALKRISEVSPGLAASNAAAILETDAEKVAAAMEKIKNALTIGLGKDIVSVFASLGAGAELAGTALSKLIEILAVGFVAKQVVTLGAWAAGLLGVAKAAKTAEVAIAATAAAEGSVAAGAASGLASRGLSGARLLGFAGAGIVIGNILGQEIKGAVESHVEGIAESIRAKFAKAIDEIHTIAQQKIHAIEVSNNERVAAILRANEPAGRQYVQELEVARETNAGILEYVKKRISSAAGAHESYLKSIESAEKASLNQIEASHGRIAALWERKDDRRFSRGLDGKDAEEQLHAYEARAKQLADRGAALMAQGARTGNARLIDQSSVLFGKADSAAGSAESIAKQLGDKKLIQESQAWQDRVTDQQVAAEQTLESLAARRVSRLQTEKDYQQSILEDVEAQAKVAITNSKITNADGSLKSEAVRKAMGAARQSALGKIDAYAMGADSGGGLDAQRASNFGLSKEFAEAILKQPRNLRLSVEDSLYGPGGVTSQLDQCSKNYKFNLQMSESSQQLWEKLTGIKLNSPQALSQAGGKIADEATANSSKKILSEADQKEIGKLQEKFQEQQPSWEVGLLATRQNQGNIKNAREQLVALANDANITKEKLLAAAEAINAIKLKPAFWGSSPGDNLTVINLSKQLGILQEIRDVQVQAAARAPKKDSAYTQWSSIVTGEQGAQARAAQVDSAISRVEYDPIEMIKRAGRAMADAIQQGADVIQQSKAYVDRTERAAGTKALQGAGHATGGMINYLASGGRGTDTINAMLSPGEMVINAGSARKFSSELTAMNSGMRPSYHTQGGSVTNVGDINVHLASGGTAHATGRTIAAEIKRELRRGSV